MNEVHRVRVLFNIHYSWLCANWPVHVANRSKDVPSQHQPGKLSKFTMRPADIFAAVKLNIAAQYHYDLYQRSSVE
ncbi:hypothetical protein J2T55_002123 [Methylohalomonas lacus]|uniref:Uncharacterized protein n=1 Tax=Methylohalomonas lacus TaxID=398773 RepID=A0AAE3L1U4_9GAMM|nr:hypothetical protein [Methylohalomonas lacus]